MALVDTTWYCNAGDQSTTGYYAVAKRPQNTAVAAGIIRRQFTAPAVGSERCFICIIAGTTANTTDATWTLTRGVKVTDGTATWQECTGQAALNGDNTNVATWAQVKAATPAVLGQIIKRSNNASYQICTTAGAMSASEPAFSDTAGTTTTDTTAVWTSLGPVSNFTTGGAAPFARLTAACATNWLADGNTLYVGDNHAESQGSTITISPVSAGGTTITKILCHNRSGSYPPAASDIMTGATVSATGNFFVNYNAGGPSYVYGIAFKGNVGGSSAVQNPITLRTSNTSGAWSYFDNCSFECYSSGGNCTIAVGGGSSPAEVMIWNNCTVYFGHISHRIIPAGGLQWRWQNTGQILVGGSAVPVNSSLILFSSTRAMMDIVLEALDLSQLQTLGTSIFGLATVGSCPLGNIIAKDCKLQVGTVTWGTPTQSGVTVQVLRSDFEAAAHQFSRYLYEGSETTDLSTSRGTTDAAGLAQCRKLATTANAQWLRPFQAAPLVVWNPTTAANVTVTVYGLYNGASLPQTDEIWLELEYLGSSTPLGKIVTTTKDNVWDTGTAVASDSSTWSHGLTAFEESLAGNSVSSATRLKVTKSNTAVLAGGAVSPDYKSSGKYYFEGTIGGTTGASDCFGIGLQGATYSAMVTSGFNCSTTIFGNNIMSNNANTFKSIGTCAAGDVVGVAVDLTARKAWFRKNSGLWNGEAVGLQDPVTGTGGATIAAGSFSPLVGLGGTGDSTTSSVTANFGQSAYVNAAPSGFSNWDTATRTPFKLSATLSSPQPGLVGYIEARVKVAKASSIYWIDPLVALS